SLEIATKRLPLPFGTVPGGDLNTSLAGFRTPFWLRQVGQTACPTIQSSPVNIPLVLSSRWTNLHPSSASLGKVPPSPVDLSIVICKNHQIAVHAARDRVHESRR
ncbi:unnamed protein product, partial [Ascophyllum nodosum]